MRWPVATKIDELFKVHLNITVTKIRNGNTLIYILTHILLEVWLKSINTSILLNQSLTGKMHQSIN